MPIAERKRQSRSSAFDSWPIALAVAVRQPGVAHHLLGVVRPALGERIADEQPAEHEFERLACRKLRKWPGHTSCTEVDSRSALPGT